MKKLAWVSLLCLGLESALEAADPGTTAANFLKLGIGPRAAAMGNAQTAVADDVFAAYWNPAGLAQLQVPEAGFVHAQYPENIQSEYSAYAYPSGRWGTFAGSFTYLAIGKFQGYDAGGQPTGDVGADDVSVNFSYAKPIVQDKRLGSLLAAGFSGKWIQERLDTVSARAYAVDAGLLFDPGKSWGADMEGWKAAVSVRNLGTALQYDRESFALPRSLTVGLSWTGEWRGETLSLAVDGDQPNDGRRTVGAGIEILTLQTLVLRAGYTSQGDVGNGLRAGAGVRLKTFSIDYAFAGGGDFGPIQHIGITFRFGKKPEDPQAKAEILYLKGLKEYRNHRYADALVDLNKALEIDPSHPQALEMMRKSYDQLKTVVPER